MRVGVHRRGAKGAVMRGEVLIGRICTPLTVRAGLVGFVAAAMVLPLWALSRSAATAVAGLMHLIVLVVALVAMLRSVRRSDPAGSCSRLFLAGSLAAVAAGNLIRVCLTVLTGSTPVPSLADPVIMAWVPLALIGFWKMPRREGSG